MWSLRPSAARAESVWLQWHFPRSGGLHVHAVESRKEAVCPEGYEVLRTARGAGDLVLLVVQPVEPFAPDVDTLEAQEGCQQVDVCRGGVGESRVLERFLGQPHQVGCFRRVGHLGILNAVGLVLAGHDGAGQAERHPSIPRRPVTRHVSECGQGRVARRVDGALMAQPGPEFVPARILWGRPRCVEQPGNVFCGAVGVVELGPVRHCSDPSRRRPHDIGRPGAERESCPRGGPGPIVRRGHQPPDMGLDLVNSSSPAPTQARS